MANIVNIRGNIALQYGQTTTTVQLADNYSPTGSNFITNAANVVTGSWSVLSQGSNTNLRYGFFQNTDATDSCYIAINSTASYAILQAGDVAMFPNSGSAVLYAKATGTNGTMILQYSLVEA